MTLYSSQGRRPPKWQRVYNELKRRLYAWFFSSEERRRHFGNGIFYNYDELWMASLMPEKCLDLICRDWRPATLLDVGCGTGATLGYFRKQGVDAWGVEGSEVAIRTSPVKDFIIGHDLRTPLDLRRKFDLVYCFEVIEHIPPSAESTFLETLMRHADRVVLSAAPPGQEGEGHLNLQPREYWVERFQARGWNYAATASDRLRQSDPDSLVRNVMIFEKASAHV